jgi:hypothetical protein
VNCPAVRSLPGTDILTDIRNHLPESHVFASKDKVNYVHEGTHGVNALLRKKHGKPGFYCLNNKAFVFDKELPGTLDEVSKRIPEPLRGSVYTLYLIKQQGDWNNHPSYLFDEFTAYLNGSLAREQLGISERSESLEHALELMVYSSYTINSNDSKIFWKYQAKRTMDLYKRSGLKFTYTESAEFKRIVRSVTSSYDLY